MTGMMKATTQIAILGFVVVTTITEPSNAFVQLSRLGTTQGARMARTLSASPFDWINDVFGDKAKETEEDSPFEWINDVFGDKTKKAEEEKAAAKARAEAQAEEAIAAAAAAEAQKQAEEKAKAKRAEEDASMVAKAKAEAAAQFEKFEVEEKAKKENEESAKAAKAKAETEAAAAAETIAAEEAAAKSEAEAEADAVAAKVIAEAEASKLIKDVEIAEYDGKDETRHMNEADSIDDHIEEAAKNNSRIMGVVQWYNGGSGFGFIKPYRTEAEEKKLIEALRGDRREKLTDKKSTTYSTGIFVHHTVIQAPDDTFFRKLYAIESVEFEIGFDKRGRPVAKNVTGPDGDYVKAIVKQQQQRTTKQK